MYMYTPPQRWRLKWAQAMSTGGMKTPPCGVPLWCPSLVVSPCGGPPPADADRPLILVVSLLCGVRLVVAPISVRTDPNTAVASLKTKRLQVILFFVLPPPPPRECRQYRLQNRSSASVLAKL